MMKNNFLLLIFFCAAVLSCKPKADLNYLQNINDVAFKAAAQNAVTTIQPGDQLAISVTAKDMDVVQPFNQNYSSTQAPAGKNISTGSTYLVDSEGFLNYPVLGRIDTKGKTVEDLRNELAGKISRYVIAPTVAVRNTNFKITVLGEVRSPGQYVIPEGQGNILSAIGMAGDLTVYGVRENILVVRNVDGVLTKQTVNLKDADFMNSDYFRLKQNDVIYVNSNETKQKQANQDPNIGLYVSVASIIVTVLALVFKK